jgi:nucleoid-associated protein YgaU
MHSDRKIGFAMGILLIGVVAALFFRNEPLPITDQLSHPRRQQLNQRLRDRDIAVYIPDEQSPPTSTQPDSNSPQWTLHSVVEEFNQESRESPVPVDAQNGRRSDLENQHRQSLDGYRTWRPGKRTSSATKPAPVTKAERGVDENSTDSSPAAAATGLQKLLRTPDENAPSRRPLPPLHASPPAIAALRSPTTATETSDTLLSDDDQSSEFSTRTDEKTPSQNAAEFDEHTVQFGETLSSIAEHHLGSQSHYRRIFEANRDRLSSPDRLKVGMRLRIPRKLVPGL